MMNYAEMLAKVSTASGFIAALDQSGGSTPKALKGYGIEEDAYTTEEEMFGLIHNMRARIITAPSFSGEKVLGAILFERTMDGEAGGKPVPTALQDRGVVPFLKVDGIVPRTTSSLKKLERSGASDGARTRDLRRDRPAL